MPNHSLRFLVAAVPTVASSRSMSVPVAVLCGLLEPLVGLAFAGLWINAEAGRGDTGIIAMCVMGLAIAVSRLAPSVSMGLVALILIGQAAHLIPLPTSTDWPVYLGISIVVGVAATNTSARIRWSALGFGAGASVAGAALMVFQNGGYGGWLSWIGWGNAARERDIVGQFAELIVAGVVVSCLAWGSGFAISATRRLFLSQRAAEGATELLALSEVELALAQERNRIAGEMHDVLAHSLAVVVAQADGARYLRRSRPAAVDDALETIAASARLALADMRGIIDGILDGTELPQPRLSDLTALIAGMASTGMSVNLRDVGERGSLGDGQQLALYRIVQEGLTNALRHRGRGCRVQIVLDWRGPGASLLLESSGGTIAAASVGAENPGAAPAATTVPPATSTPEAGPASAAHQASDVTRAQPGRGVIGMRERAHVAGGWLTVGMEEDGTHRLTAFIPYYVSGTVPSRTPELARS